MAFAETHLPPLPVFSSRLRSESFRLREELIKAHLELSHTLAGIATESRYSDRLRHSCYKAARNGYNRAMTMLGSEGPPSKAIEISIHRLRSTLMRLKPTPGVPAEQAERNGTPAATSRPRLSASKSANGTDKLTPRETQVLKCIAEGQSTKELAGVLGITFKTAACHRERIMCKLNAHSSAVLVRYAIRAGLIQP
jgi:DNA-binding CsgD family transcriptional regulator